MAGCWTWAVYMLGSRSCKYDDVFYEKHCSVSFSTVDYLYSVKKGKEKLLLSLGIS